MSSGKDKKIRQLYRRQIQVEAKKQIDELLPKLKQVVKPSPKYFPKRLWDKLAGLFLSL